MDPMNTRHAIGQMLVIIIALSPLLCVFVMALRAGLMRAVLIAMGATGAWFACLAFAIWLSHS